MAENLLTPSGIKLYGRVVTDLAVTPHTPNNEGLGTNKFLLSQLVKDARGNAPSLARIYAFSHEGHYYDLPKPAIFLVHGPGAPITPTTFTTTSTTAGGTTTTTGGTLTRSDVDSSGVVAKEWEFSGDANLLMWEYDKGDYSIRLDIETGPFEQILLAAALRGGASPYSSGADLRSSGADLRSSGADLRSSGADLRMSGADLRRR